MQHLLQLKRAESILQTTESVEIWECDVVEYEPRFGKTWAKDVKIGVILALPPPRVPNHCHLNSHILKSYAQVRTMLFDYCRAQADAAAGDVVPMDLSMLGEGKGQERQRQQTRQRQRTLSSSSESIGENDRMGKESEWNTKSCDAGTDVAHFARLQYAEDLELDMSVALSVVHMFDRLETTDVITTQMRRS